MPVRFAAVVIVALVALAATHRAAGQPAACEILMPEGVEAGQFVPTLWPGGVVYYEFDDNVSPVNQQKVLQAMAVLEAVAAVTFVPRNDEPNWVHIQSGNGNSSHVGMIGGQQLLTMASWSSSGDGGVNYVIVHELMHALGLWHEQSRPDRDEYVDIIWRNIAIGFEHNFDIERWAVGQQTPYDFESVMHYGQCAFTTCGGCNPGCETIIVQPPNENWQGLIGQYEHLSDLDIQDLADLYLAPVNDACIAPLPIDSGSTPFSTVGATTDGPSHPACAVNGDGGSCEGDVWFRYTAACHGVMRVTTCEHLGGSADFDTKIFIYNGPVCGAPVSACNDDDADNPCGASDGQSTAFAVVEPGSEYLIRVGGSVPGDFGEGTLNITCTPVEPVGACCVATACGQMTETQCAALSGVFHGPDSLCSQSLCAAGACCLPDGACIVLQPDECAAQNGTFSSAAVPCAEVTCPGACPADVTVDGQVGVDDLLVLLAAWGDCGKRCDQACLEDLDGDCSVGTGDLLDLLSAWGSCP